MSPFSRYHCCWHTTAFACESTYEPHWCRSASSSTAENGFVSILFLKQRKNSLIPCPLKDARVPLLTRIQPHRTARMHVPREGYRDDDAASVSFTFFVFFVCLLVPGRVIAQLNYQVAPRIRTDIIYGRTTTVAATTTIIFSSTLLSSPDPDEASPSLTHSLSPSENRAPHKLGEVYSNNTNSTEWETGRAKAHINLNRKPQQLTRLKNARYADTSSSPLQWQYNWYVHIAYIKSSGGRHTGRRSKHVSMFVVLLPPLLVNQNDFLTSSSQDH